MVAITGVVAAENYIWDNVLLGGGGYVIGIEIHPKNPELIYIRTDVGGCYRWFPQEQRMRQLMKHIPDEKKNMWGVWGLALDPTDQNIVYTANGKYPGREADILKSTDQGANWTPMNFPHASFGSNNHPHRQSKPLAVNPLKPSELWSGTMGNGVYKYTGDSWQKVNSISNGTSTRTIIFDPGNPEYVYVAVYGAGVYRSTDNGESFSKMGSSQSSIVDMALSKDGDILYIVGSSGLQKCTDCRSSTQWSGITPEGGQPYRVVSASPHDNGVVMTFRAKYGNLKRFWVSTDAGENWDKHAPDFDNIDQRFPWHKKYMAGSCVSEIAFDPVTPKKIYFSDWYSLWYTDDWSKVPVLWSNKYGVGHEELCCAILRTAHPDNSYGAILYSGGADVGGFSSTALREPPQTKFRGNTDAFREVMGADFSESNPDFMAVVGAQKWSGSGGDFGYSTDGGKTIIRSNGYSGGWGGGKVAISAVDHTSLVVAPKSSGVKYSTDGGKSFHSSSAPSVSVGGVFSYTHILASDRVNGDFYIVSGGALYRSSDGGKSFKKSGSPAGERMVAAAPGVAGLVYSAGGGVYKTTNGGGDSRKIAFFSDARLVAVGIPKPGTTEPSVFVYGQGEGDNGNWIYRSDDGGESWTKINDSENRLGNNPGTFAASRRVWGRVFMGTHGSGVFYGDIETEVSVQRLTVLDGAGKETEGRYVLSGIELGFIHHRLFNGYSLVSLSGREIGRTNLRTPFMHTSSGVYCIRHAHENTTSIGQIIMVK
jgi:photosystem II stability/assembly factor-like uncharacterized protein